LVLFKKPKEAPLFDVQRTALVLIDLQKRIMAMPLAPHPASEVVARAATLADRCRALGMPVVLVTIDFHPRGLDRASGPVDSPLGGSSQPDPSGLLLAHELGSHPEDLRVTKHQWGAFYGTDLDLQLRRRGIQTMLLGGIATNFGVESTGRDAWEHNYGVIFLEDAMTSVSAEAHQFAVTTVFPRIGRVRSTEQVLKVLGEPSS
jgi:nicotinamidase-related amidase